MELFFASLLFIDIVALIIVYVVIFIDMSITDAPFVLTRDTVIPKIIEHMKLSNESVVYELGCGNAHVLHAILAQFPQAHVIGVERGFFAYIAARIKAFRTSVKIVYGSYMNVSLADATHIYCYLSSRALKKLSIKFSNECKPGTRIVTCGFLLPGWTPVEHVTLSKSHELNQDLHVYVKS
jgi:hypothetical protein